jgi:O-methyltransferase involved in polyketide biosynthesis
MYLPAEVVGSVLRWVGEQPDHSSIAFDYMDRRFFAVGRRFSAQWRVRRLLELSGERLVYGSDPVAVPALMREHGLKIKCHLRSADIEAKYLWRDGEVAGPLSPYFAFVHG